MGARYSLKSTVRRQGLQVEWPMSFFQDSKEASDPIQLTSANSPVTHTVSVSKFLSTSQMPEAAASGQMDGWPVLSHFFLLIVRLTFDGMKLRGVEGLMTS